MEYTIPAAALNHLRAKHQEFQQAVALVLMGMGVNGAANYDLDRGVVTVVDLSDDVVESQSASNG